MLYSPSTGGFYRADLHGDAIPGDVVAITAARHTRLLALQAGGAVITAGPKGRPHARRERLPLADQRDAAVAIVKREAAHRIERVAPLWRQLNDLADAHLMSTDQRAARDGRQGAIRAIRAASDRLEAAIATMNAAELRTLAIGADAHWPEA